MRIVNIIRSRFTIVLAVFSLMIGGAAFLFAGMASAGTDGQQIEFFNGNSGEVAICGTDQRGDNVCTVWDTDSHHETSKAGWWWIGTVAISGDDGSHVICHVPLSYPVTFYPCGTLP